MNFDDRLARRLKAMGQSLAGDPLEFSEVMDRARSARRRQILAVAAAVTLLVVATTGALVLRDTDDGAIPPANEGAPEVTETTPSPSPAPEEGPDCSAVSISPVPETPATELPAPVRDTRAAIIEVATVCDYDALAEIGLNASDGSFSWTVGDSSPPPPQRFWRAEERLDTEPLGSLVKLLNMDFVVEHYGGEDHYVWPTAQRSSGPTSEDFATLVEAGVLTSKEASAMEESQIYLGWRLSISESGDWEFYTAGD